MLETEQDGPWAEAGYSRKDLLKMAGGFALGASTLGLVACGGSGGGGSGGGQSAGPRQPIALSKAPTAPFDPNVRPGLKPNLPHRMAWSLPANGELYTTFDNNMRDSSKQFGLDYISGQANGDSTKQFQQTQDFLSRGLGALVVTDIAPPALKTLQLQAIGAGTAVFTGVNAFSTCQFTADQYKEGYGQAIAAVRYINASLGGNAQVVMFSSASAGPQFEPRWQGIRDALRTGGPGIKLVADLSISALSPDEGYKLANTALQKHPDANIWIAGDSALAGVLAALKAAGKVGPTTGLFGIDGDAQALKEIEQGGPYKASQAVSFALVGYAFAKYAADWLAGKSIPMILSMSGIELTSKATIDAFNRVDSDPASAFAENESSGKYFAKLGNTSYEQHRYLTVVAA